MQITKDHMTNETLIRLTNLESIELTEQLISHVGQSRQPLQVVDQLVNFLAALHPKEENE